MILHHIDNGFFRLTRRQAKKLTYDGCIPAQGIEKRAPKDKLEPVTLFYNARQGTAKATGAAEAWVKWTTVNREAVLALYLWFRP